MLFASSIGMSDSAARRSSPLAGPTNLSMTWNARECFSQDRQRPLISEDWKSAISLDEVVPQMNECFCSNFMPIPIDLFDLPNLSAARLS